MSLVTVHFASEMHDALLTIFTVENVPAQYNTKQKKQRNKIFNLKKELVQQERIIN